ASGEPARPSTAGAASAAGGLHRCRYSGVASAERGLRYAVSLLKMRAFGFRQIKLKLGRDGTLTAAKTARRILGRRVDLRVDANMAWGVTEALDLIGKLRAVGITSFEQPVHPDDLTGLARL